MKIKSLENILMIGILAGAICIGVGKISKKEYLNYIGAGIASSFSISYILTVKEKNKDLDYQNK